MSRQEIFGKLIADLAAATKQELGRTPEPTALTTNDDSIFGYDLMMGTNMTVNYAAGMDFIHRVREEFKPASPKSALDLCCGPGHLSICLTQFLGYEKVIGVDASEPMVRVAGKNGKIEKAPVRFSEGDVRYLTKQHIGAEQFDLALFTNSAHHMDTKEDVTAVLDVAEKACRPDGVIVVTDMCRMPTADLTERFVNIVGEEYEPAMFQDFKNSMHAAWSKDELPTMIPQSTGRVWWQIVSGVLPYYQVLIGLPVGREQLFLRDSLKWEEAGLFRSATARSDWETTKDGYYNGITRQVRKPAQKTGKKVAA